MQDRSYDRRADSSTAEIEIRTDYSEPDNLLRPLKAIRAKCKDCTGGSSHEVKLCPSYHCPLWPYRLGKRPTAELYSSKPPRYSPSKALPVANDHGFESDGQAAETRRSCASESKNGKPGGAR